MNKINSKYIKDNVKCVHCGEGGKKLKRTHKQSFKSPMNADLENKPEKFEWRQFSCDCGYTTNVLNTENKLLSVTEEAVTPFSAFNFYFTVEEEFSLYLFYKDSIKGEVIEDDVRDEMIFNFNEFFAKHHMAADNLMENCWEITFDKFYYNFKDVKEAIAVAKNVLLKSGAKYDLEMAMEMEDEYSEEEFDLENAYIPETEERIIQRKVDSF